MENRLFIKCLALQVLFSLTWLLLDIPLVDTVSMMLSILLTLVTILLSVINGFKALLKKRFVVNLNALVFMIQLLIATSSISLFFRDISELSTYKKLVTAYIQCDFNPKCNRPQDIYQDFPFVISRYEDKGSYRYISKDQARNYIIVIYGRTTIFIGASRRKEHSSGFRISAVGSFSSFEIVD